MTPVIKSVDLKRDGAVRSLFATPTIPPISEAVRRIEDLELQLDTERDKVSQLLADQSEAERSAEKSRVDAYDKGMAAGVQLAEDQGAALRLRLDQAANEASSAFTEASTTLSALAADVAVLALSRIVGDPCSRRDLVMATVQRAVAELVGDAEIVIEVSQEDFPDGLFELADIAVGPKRRVEISLGLPSGGCRIHLPLGLIDLGLSGQVDRLRSRLSAPVMPTP